MKKAIIKGKYGFNIEINGILFRSVACGPCAAVLPSPADAHDEKRIAAVRLIADSVNLVGANIEKMSDVDREMLDRMRVVIQR